MANNTTTTRLNILKSFLKTKAIKQTFEAVFNEHEGDWRKIQAGIQNIPGLKEKGDTLEFIHRLADFSSDHLPLVKAFVDNKQTNSLRDIALNYGKTELLDLVAKTDAPTAVAGETPEQKQVNYVKALADKLFTEVPTAVVQRIVGTPTETPISDPILRGGLVTFLNNQGASFNIKTTSIYEAFKAKNAFEGIAPALYEGIKTASKTLQRITAISPVAEAVPVLMKANIHTAFQVSEMSERQFIQAFKGTLGENGETIARQIHYNAVNSRIRNEHALMALKEVGQGTGVAFIDKVLFPGKDKTNKVQKGTSMSMAHDFGKELLTKTLPEHNLSWDLLFGDADDCECEECSSVYSAASYFVELLQYLRNNNLDDNSKNDPSIKIKADIKDISGTPLEKLFARRPDLACLELTCENTNTILPYVDLVNEVMECYVAYKQPKPFNVSDETSSELLAQPQHTNHQAYRILSEAVYPFTLPYHQPVDAARVFLKSLGTSRYEIMDTFRSSDQSDNNQDDIRRDFHTEYLNRTADAEFLELTEEEYIILTNEAFISKANWDSQTHSRHTLDEYHARIGVKKVYEYYGYKDKEFPGPNIKPMFTGENEMLDIESGTGLSFVKQQFLPRTGIGYSDLVKLLQTETLNPNMPKGEALAIMEQIRGSYHYLKSLVDYSAKDKYKNLIAYLNQQFSTFLSVETLPTNDSNASIHINPVNNVVDWAKWVNSFFEKIGQIIVLEGGNDPTLPIDSCNVDNIRLLHLDGSSLNSGEYDRFHRFIRLWRKLGWTIDETDKALVGLSNNFITPKFLHQVVAVKKLLDKTGLELIKLLTFWTDISTTGEKSLYRRLFLSPNLRNVNLVFQAKNGSYLSDIKTKIKDHIPVLMAALRVKTEDITAINGPSGTEKELNLPNVSIIYRHSLLAKILGVQVPDLAGIVTLFGDPFADADATLKFLDRWGKMEDSGFSYRQLNYLINDIDDAKKPLSPSELTILQLAKTLYDGLNAIDETHKDLAADTETTDLDEQTLEIQAHASTELVKSKAALLFDPSLVDKIIGILEGTIVFSTYAQPGLDILISDKTMLSKKLKYNKTEGTVQITGILTDTEIIEFNNLNTDENWLDALKTIEKQQAKLFKEVLFAVFETEKLKSSERKAIVEESEKTIKDGDIYIPLDFTNEPQTGNTDTPQKVDKTPKGFGDNTAASKRPAFLTVFLPYLRQELTHRFVVDTLSNSVGLQRETTDVLISEVLMLNSAPIYTVFEKIRESAKPVENNWQGYLIPTAEGDYSFIVKTGVKNFSISVESFPPIEWEQQDEPTTEWWANTPVKLQAGKLYKFSVTGIYLTNVFWKTATSAITAIPPSVLLPDFASQKCESAFVLLKKAALLVSGFNLSADEIRYSKHHEGDKNDKDDSVGFDGFNFNTLTLLQWMRLEAYTRLRNSLPKTGTNILEFFKWANTPEPQIHPHPLPDSINQPDQPGTINPGKKVILLSQKIAQLTLWDEGSVQQLIDNAHFNLESKNYFCNEVNLLKLQNALKIADKTGMDIASHFEWAEPSSIFLEELKPKDRFEKYWSIANNIQSAIRAKYKQEDWYQVMKPLSDKLRNNQKEALIAYLLQQPELIRWEVTDADGLFEYFLIDVQMDACMQTSRIKQAISSVQLFIQRCFLGLEEKHSSITPDILDRERWEWMQRYRVWEANRKVFLYPENWIESNLRDDKSPFFKELESELLQKDINKQNVTDALKSYLYKVDEVANMEVIGLYIEGTITGENWDEGSKLHVFSRTRNAPYFFYYRYLALDEMNWYAWEKMQVDIPSYDAENEEKYINKDPAYPNPNYGNNNGVYLIPVVWNGRLLVFFPQFMKKTRPSDNANIKDKKIVEIGNNATQEDMKPIEYYEIKMAWSEYRNKKWTQKQISKDIVIGNYLDISIYKFIPFIKFDSVLISVDDNPDSDNIFLSTFWFDGNDIHINKFTQNINDTNFITINRFNKETTRYSDTILIWQPSWQFNWQETNKKYERVNIELGFYETLAAKEPLLIFNRYQEPPPQIIFSYLYSQILLGEINKKQLEAFFRYNTEGAMKLDKANAFGTFDDDDNSNTPDIYNELKRPYSLYNWELFFHTPMMLADALSKAQQFEEAMKWYHFVFSPMADGNEDTRFWQFLPFKEINSQHILASIFNRIEANSANGAISDWRNHPFMPHWVARDRPVAYMKWVVMKYIDNLVAWGDYLFRQDTIESINQATQLYVLAGHILGPRPQKIPKRGKKKPQTYQSLLDKWDAFGNAMVELELAAPYSNQTSLPLAIGKSGYALANIFGTASALYFSIPNNPKLLAYWDTIGDRLFKIRHCQNIEGLFRQLPLFEPPIDPALLVKAAAQGLSIASVLNDLNTPMPNYRFYYLLQKALELCGELKSLGGAMLSAIEKKDNEAISLMRAKHESTMNNLVMEIKKQQLEEAQKSLETLQNNRKAPEHRMKYYLQLIGEDAGKVPGLDSDFSEIANAIEMPVDESGLKLSKFEKEEMDKAGEAHFKQSEAGQLELLASIYHLYPSIRAATEPLGVGASIEFGGPFLAGAVQAIAKSIQNDASRLSYNSTNAGRKGGFTRAIQDRIFQANAAGYEIKQIDKQITAQQIRISIANLDISNQQKQIDNANEVEEFLKNKYTNEELYAWMRDSLKMLYRQVYHLAYDLAKKAEKTYHFERGLSNSNFIQSGYWDAGRDGLLAGEQLFVGLKELEAANQENRGYDYEITKNISLRQINPIAVLQLKETGKCEFMLPEVLFDMDFPGHFKRRIKSVSISIPCVAGPYTSINGTLRLLENKFRNTAIGGKTYAENTEETDERFSTYIIPISAIATSSAQNDSGMFELNFKDERYLPFEGAGVASKWRLELPAFCQFDYNTISDVVVHLRYTATDGGERLKFAATNSVTEFIKNIEETGQMEGLFAIIDLQNDLPTEWHKAVQSKDTSFTIPDLKRFLPYYAVGKNVKLINAQFFHSKEIDKISYSGDLNLTDQSFSVEPCCMTVQKAYMIIQFAL